MECYYDYLTWLTELSILLSNHGFCRALYRRWLNEHKKLDFLVKKTKTSKRAQSLFRRFTVSRSTWLVRKDKDITQTEVSIFDERRKTLIN